MGDTYIKTDRNKYGLPKGLKSSGGGKKDGGISTDTFKKMRNNLTMSFDYENLDEQIRRNIKNPKYRNADGSFNKEKYDADKGSVETKKGAGRPRNKGGAIVKSQSSSVTPATKSEIVKSKGGQLAKKEKSTSNKTEPGKPKDDKIKLTKNKQSLGVGKVMKKAGPYVKAAATVAKVAYKGVRAVGGMSKAFDPKSKGWESYIQRTTDNMID